MKKILILILALTMLLAACGKSGDSVSDYPEPDKICALTFDDGPNTELTALVLDKLEKYDVVATFFMVGMNINDDTADIVKRVVDMGNEIGNHSWTYEGMQDMSSEQIAQSVADTTAAIKKYSGKTPAFFRAPNLSVSDTMYDTIDLPFASGVLGFDWAGEDTTAQDRADKVLDGMKDGAIILLHDVQPLPHPTPEALDILIPELKKMGYKFVTLSELFKLKGVTPDKELKDQYVYVE